MASLLPSLGRRKLPMLEMPKAGGSVSALGARSFAAGSWSFVAPRDGLYLFDARGAGGSGGVTQNNGPPNATGGASGARGFRKIMLKKGDAVQISVGTGGASVGNTNGGAFTVDGKAGNQTSLAFPDGTSMTLGGGAGGRADFAPPPGGPGASLGGQPSGKLDRAYPGAVGGVAGYGGVGENGAAGGFGFASGNRNVGGGASAPGSEFVGPDSAAGNSAYFNSYSTDIGSTPGPGSGSGGAIRDGNFNYGIYSAAGGDGLVIVVYAGQ